MSKAKATAHQRLATNMRTWREDQGITSQRLAGDHAKFPGTMWWKLENGSQDPRLSTLVRLAEGMGVELVDLFK